MSWTLGVDVTAADECGLKTWGMDGKSWESTMKKTRFMSNIPELLPELTLKCDEQHRHQQLLGSRAGPAARYPEGLCRAICMGLMKGLRNKECHVKKKLELTEHTTIGEILEEETVDFDVEAWDDVTGKALEPKAVRQARLKEMRYVKEKEVWQPISLRRGWKVVKTRWIDINKGDEDTPNYRSRLVAKEFNDGAGEGLFASTPPLEALRFLVSVAATVRGGGRGRTLDHEPIRHARRRREQGGPVQNSPSVYHNKECGLITLVRGDDFITVGNRKNIRWLKNKLEGRFEIKTKIIGQGEGKDREARALNRIIRVTPEGWEYEPDQRLADILSMNLSGAKGVIDTGGKRRTGR